MPINLFNGRSVTLVDDKPNGGHVPLVQVQDSPGVRVTGALTAGGQTVQVLAAVLDGARSVLVDWSGTHTGVTLFAEARYDGANWVALGGVLVGLNQTFPSSGFSPATNNAGAATFAMFAPGDFRVRASAVGTGSLSVGITPAQMPSAQAVGVYNISAMAAGTNRTGFVAQSGIWWDDTVTPLAGGATFTGASRDALATLTGTGWNNAVTWGQAVRIGAESDVAGTLWLEVSRDNTTWVRVQSVATAAVTGGGQAATLTYLPFTRWWRAGYTNGAGAQARFILNSVNIA